MLVQVINDDRVMVFPGSVKSEMRMISRQVRVTMRKVILQAGRPEPQCRNQRQRREDAKQQESCF